jgi:hypothetical protein
MTILTFCTLIALPLSFSSQAETYQTSCNECTQSYQFKNTAESLVLNKIHRRFNGDIYVFNYKEGIAKKYNVSAEYLDIQGGPLHIFALEKSLSTSQQFNFSIASDAYNEITNSIQDIILPEYVADSAYDLVGASYVENDISDYLATNQTFKDKVNAFISVAAKITGHLPSDISIVLKMSFKDGSWANFKIFGLDKGGNMSLSFQNGRDKDNNTITNNPSHYKSGAFRFFKGGQSAVNNFIAAASRAGVTITNGNSKGSSGRKMSCTGSAVKGTLVCKVINNSK